MKTFILSLTISLTVLGYINNNDTTFLSDKSESPFRAVPDYDMYVFAIQWGPTMCISGGSTCTSKLSNIPKNNMSIHGLWPNLQSGATMDTCNSGTEVTIKDDGSSVFLTMRKYWPSLTSSTNEYFWGHEYNKHGYCYCNKIGNFDYKKYFEKAIDLLTRKKINTLIVDTFGTQTGEYTLSYSTFMSNVQAKVGGSYFTPVCYSNGGKYYLKELRFTFDLNFNYMKSSSSQQGCKTSGDIIIPYF